MRKGREVLCGLALAGLLAAAGCGATEAGSTVKQYVSRLHAGQYEQAYAMLTSQTHNQLSLEQWKQGMHTEALADVQDLSVKELRVLSPGGTCVHTQLDFVSRNDHGPYGHYIFYLQKEDDAYRIQDVLTYDRIEGEGFVQVGHFDESREPFPCSGPRP